MGTITKGITKSQLTSSVTRAKQYVVARLGDISITVADALEELADAITDKADKPCVYSVSIPTSAWNTNTDTDMTSLGYQYYASATINDITTNHMVEAEVDSSCLNEAYNCRIAPYTKSVNGAIYFYTKKRPTVTLSFKIKATLVITS